MSNIDSWNIILLAEVEDWYLGLCAHDEFTAAKVEQAIEMLAEEGPSLGRPFVDRVKASRHHNMKELRPTRSDAHIRILFAFDPRRRAILCVAGEKSGLWDEWYRVNIPVADDRYDRWLSELAEEVDHD